MGITLLTFMQTTQITVKGYSGKSPILTNTVKSCSRIKFYSKRSKNSPSVLFDSLSVLVLMLIYYLIGERKTNIIVNEEGK